MPEWEIVIQAGREKSGHWADGRVEKEISEKETKKKSERDKFTVEEINFQTFSRSDGVINANLL